MEEFRNHCYFISVQSEGDEIVKLEDACEGDPTQQFQFRYKTKMETPIYDFLAIN